jgi:hypothetical protein
MDIASITIKDVLTLAVAAWGAALSTYIYFRQNRRAKEIVRVTSQVYLEYEIIEVTTMNLGKEKIYLRPPVFTHKTKGRSIKLTPTFDERYPITVESGEAVSHRVNFTRTIDKLRESEITMPAWVIPVCRTSSGAQFKGRRLKLDLKFRTMMIAIRARPDPHSDSRGLKSPRPRVGP